MRRKPPGNRPRLGAGIHPGQIEHRIGPRRHFDVGIVTATSDHPTSA